MKGRLGGCWAIPLVLLACGCPSDDIGDPLPVYAAILSETTQLEVAMPRECAEPVTIFVEIDGQDPPHEWLNAIGLQCHTLQPGSQYHRDIGVFVHFNDLQWVNPDTVIVRRSMEYIGGGGSGVVFTVERGPDGWNVANRDVKFQI